MKFVAYNGNIAILHALPTHVFVHVRLAITVIPHRLVQVCTLKRSRGVLCYPDTQLFHNHIHIYITAALLIDKTCQGQLS